MPRHSPILPRCQHRKTKTLNVVEVINLALDIFTEDYISFNAEEEEIIAKFDRTQLIRVVTNLVKNANQAIIGNNNPRIFVDVYSSEKNVIVKVTDNGSGISDDNKAMVFEPKFTTKSSGKGAWIANDKKHRGNLWRKHYLYNTRRKGNNL